MAPSALLHPDLHGQFPLLAEGKVRVIYELDDDDNVKDGKQKLLFVATDRISANDVIMKNVCLSCRYYYQICDVDVFEKIYNYLELHCHIFFKPLK